MFQQPFSFNGRIRRTEYGITLLINYAYLHLVMYVIRSGVLPLDINEANVSLYVLLFLIPAIIFALAQGAKRCHDVGKNGFWQLIPLFFIFLLLQAPDPWYNKYGNNPRKVNMIKNRQNS